MRWHWWCSELPRAMLKKFHKEILTELKRHSGRGTKRSGNTAYLGNDHFSYLISNPVKRQIVIRFLAKHKALSQKEFVALLDALYKGRSHDEKSIAGMLLEYSEQHRLEIAPPLLDKWLNYLEGWAEVDSLCQSNFTAEEMFVNWSGSCRQCREAATACPRRKLSRKGFQA